MDRRRVSLSSFDKRLLADGPAFFDRPRLASLLELLGDSKFERVDALATMLRHCPPNEFEEFADVVDRALARAARDQARGRDDEIDRAGEPRRRRYSRAAERREQRRRTG
jgi:hypothetical protein